MPNINNTRKRNRGNSSNRTGNSNSNGFRISNSSNVNGNGFNIRVNRSNLTKRRHIEKPQEKLIKDNPYEAVLSFRRQLDTVPVYAIVCHSAICNSYKDCDSTRTGEPFFDMPDRTFLFNLTSGGEFCTPSSGFYDSLNAISIRNYIIAENMQDSVRTYANPLLSTAMRAASGQRYPNLNCTFVEDEGVHDELGIYEIGGEKIVLDKSRTWFLDEIILEVYRISGKPEGIFIFSGCSNNYEHETFLKSIGPTNNAIEIIRKADMEYNNRVLTMPLLGTNVGAVHSVSMPEPIVIVDMALTMGDPLTLWSDDTEDLITARNILFEFAKDDKLIEKVAAHYEYTIPKIMAHIAIALGKPIGMIFSKSGKLSKYFKEALKIFNELNKANKNAANGNAGTNQNNL